MSEQTAEIVRSDYEGACMEHQESAATIRDILSRAGDKWTLLIISTLEAGSLRFGDIRQHVPGISQRMLTRTLRMLQRDGLVSREAYREVPPRVEYELTEVGRTLLEPALALAAWVIENQDVILAAREQFDDESATEN